MERIAGSFGGFAAVLCDTTVVTWGDSDSGGDWVFLTNECLICLIAEPQGIPRGCIHHVFFLGGGSYSPTGDSTSVREKLTPCGLAGLSVRVKVLPSETWPPNLIPEALDSLDPGLLDPKLLNPKPEPQT